MREMGKIVVKAFSNSHWMALFYIKQLLASWMVEGGEKKKCI